MTSLPAHASDRGLLGYLGLACGIILATVGLVIGLNPGLLDDAPASTATGSLPTDLRVAGPPPPAKVAPKEVTPVRLEIPAIGLDRSLLMLGLDAHHQLQVPTMAQAGRPGWYRYSPTPGDVGPSVIAGHVDSTSGPAVFYRLRDLGKGDTVRVRRADGRLAIFTVDKVQLVKKRAFPTQEVYGPIRYAGLRLITCGGGYDKAKGGYQSNLVVFARLKRIVRSTT